MPRLTRGERLILELRAKGIRASRPPFPDLKCDKPGLAPLSHNISVPGANTPSRDRGESRAPTGFMIGHSHKQGLSVIPLKEAQWAGGKKT